MFSAYESIEDGKKILVVEYNRQAAGRDNTLDRFGELITHGSNWCLENWLEPIDDVRVLRPEDVGALTSSRIIGYGVETVGDRIDQLKAELEELVTYGTVWVSDTHIRKDEVYEDTEEYRENGLAGKNKIDFIETDRKKKEIRERLIQGNFYWSPNYAVIDEAYELLTTGQFVFDIVPTAEDFDENATEESVPDEDFGYAGKPEEIQETVS